MCSSLAHRRIGFSSYLKGVDWPRNLVVGWLLGRGLHLIYLWGSIVLIILPSGSAVPSKPTHGFLMVAIAVWLCRIICRWTGALFKRTTRERQSMGRIAVGLPTSCRVVCKIVPLRGWILLVRNKGIVEKGIGVSCFPFGMSVCMWYCYWDVWKF